MAETIISSLIDRLVSLLTQEAELLRGIDGEVVDIKDELRSIQSFLKDADARAAAEADMGESESVKEWVAQHGPHRQGFTGFVHKTTHSLKTLKPRHKIAKEIEEIKASVQKIAARRQRYDFQSTGQGSSSDARNVRGLLYKLHKIDSTMDS
ncbi:hypothetical protein CMV_030458 [Castanea mollissima]|uniref:Disease resistance N-terminal domain-containing protein n=1 Tax=Castanea mollissima TaxID=60419 RepID=A0A8J4Q359_9ROSI|nr:hypothetical protein CMV_030458 [Castanea mollissima]